MSEPAGLSGTEAPAWARQMLLAGCDLPAAWRGRASFIVAATGFGHGLNFLVTWQAWRDDPRRPSRLHYVALAPGGLASSDLIQAASPHAPLSVRARELAAHWPAALTAGFHRIELDQGALGCVRLTLCIGDALELARQWRFAADAIYLDGPGFDRMSARPLTAHGASASSSHVPSGANGVASGGDLPLLRALARSAAPGARLAGPASGAPSPAALARAGFVVPTRPEPSAARAEAGRGAAVAPAVSAHYAPRWPLPARAAPSERSAVVIGAGLAGAAVCSALARRGWSLSLIDLADGPARGASSLPAGLAAPHCTARDTALSRLSRAGLARTLAELRRLLPPGDDWASGEITDLHAGATAPLALSGLRARPAALVRAWLDEAARRGLRCHWGLSAHALRRDGGSWCVLDAGGAVIASAPTLVLAAAIDTLDIVPAALRPALPLNPVRGQLSFGPRPQAMQDWPTQPVQGGGVFIPAFRQHGEWLWAAGATFDRGVADARVTAQAHEANWRGLARLLPGVAAALRPQFEAGAVRGWSRVRCTSTDRLPLVGTLPDAAAVRAHQALSEVPRLPGLLTLTALGSRGLTLAALAAELLACQLEGEPLPVEQALADALDPARFALRQARRDSGAASPSSSV